MLTLQQATTSSRLKAVWRSLLDGVDEHLVRDPLDYTGFEVRLQENIDNLRIAARHGGYVPKAPTHVRLAKRNGLTRLIQSLDIPDAILLKSIADLLQENLHRVLPACSRFSRSQDVIQEDESVEYVSWFEAFTRHDRCVKSLLVGEGISHVVTADVANFFPTIDHRILRQMIAVSGNAESRLTNLLFLIIQRMSWRPDYGHNRGIGIPIEQYDASRILAHAYMQTVDHHFDDEIQEGRYARWVDDITVGCRSRPEAKQVLSRLQFQVEKIGLFLNSSKSKIIPASEFAALCYPEVNELLDRMHEVTASDEEVTTDDREAFETSLGQHLNGPRLSTWDRVLRRFYTEGRRLGSDSLEEAVVSHIAELPSMTRSALNYLMGRPFNHVILGDLLSYLQSDENIYEDVEVQVWSFLGNWRIPPALSEEIADAALGHIQGAAGFGRPHSDYSCAVAIPVIAKHGNARQMKALRRLLGGRLGRSKWGVRYALCALVGTPAHRTAALRTALRFEDPAVRRIHDFVTTLVDDPRQYDQVLRKRIRVIESAPPLHAYLPAKWHPFIALPREQHSYAGTWDNHLQVLETKLRTPMPELRDGVSLLSVRRAMERPVDA